MITVGELLDQLRLAIADGEAESDEQVRVIVPGGTYAVTTCETDGHGAIVLETSA